MRWLDRVLYCLGIWSPGYRREYMRRHFPFLYSVLYDTADDLSPLEKGNIVHSQIAEKFRQEKRYGC